MLSYIIWLVIALIIVIVEMNLMSFYLMAVALGAAAGGITAYMSYDLPTQGIVAGIVTIISSCGSFYLRRKLKNHQDKMNNDLDRGQRVVIKDDRLNEDGTATVSYRGADWVAYKENAPLTAGIYFIARIDGTRLVLGDQIPTAATGANAADTGANTDTVATTANETRKAEDNTNTVDADTNTPTTGDTQASTNSTNSTNSTSDTETTANGSTNTR